MKEPSEPIKFQRRNLIGCEKVKELGDVDCSEDRDVHPPFTENRCYIALLWDGNVPPWIPL